MKDLKDKLAEKVNIISPEDPTVNSNKEPSQSNNIIVLNGKDESTLLPAVPDFEITLSQARERISMLQRFIREMMVQGIDYGLIPGCQKPSLYKSGAEKLCDIFGFSKQFDIIQRYEDWDKGVFYYEVKAILRNKRTGLIEAEGLGSCNNKEKKYKNQDSFTILNTILKMAKKRALVDGILSATRSSGIFTQDIEDLDTPEPPIKSDNIIPGNPNIEPSISIQQVYDLAKKKNISAAFIKTLMIRRYNANSSSELTQPQVSDLYKYLTGLMQSASSN